MLLAITRPVPPSLEQCELTHVARQHVDVSRARRQHRAYEAVLEAHGCALQRLPLAPELPDSVFVEDTAVVLPECAVITRPGAPSRRPETEAMADALRPHREIVTMTAPATLDGGDVLRVGRSVFVGRSARTNEDGIRQLGDTLAPHGYTVIGVSIRGCLHLKSAASSLGDGRLLVNPRCVEPSAFGELPSTTVEVSEPHAANVLAVGGVVVVPADAPRTRSQLERAGYVVVPLDASELAKAEAGLTCCSVLVEI